MTEARLHLIEITAQSNAEAFQTCTEALGEAGGSQGAAAPEAAPQQQQPEAEAPDEQAPEAADEQSYLEMALDAGKRLQELEDTYNPSKVLGRAASATLTAVYDQGSAWLWGQQEEGPDEDAAANQNAENQAGDVVEEPPPDGPDLPPIDGIVYTIGQGRGSSGTGNSTKVTAKYDAKWRDPSTGGVSGGNAPNGLKVTVVGDKTMRCVVHWDGKDITTYRTFAQVVTVAGESQTITKEDNKWLRMDNLIAGGGEDSTLGNESTEEGQTEADAVRDGLPPGRSPGSSGSNWSTSSTFSLKMGEATLNQDLFQRVVAMLQWAIENDMLVGDAIMTDGVRAPEIAHRMSTSYQIKSGKIPLERLQSDQGYGIGTDADGNVWYVEGDDLKAVKTRATAIYDQNAFAAEGYGQDDERRWPNLGVNTVSNHLTGQAIDCHIPWRAPGEGGRSAEHGGHRPAGG